jgi:hypothetical protein
MVDPVRLLERVHGHLGWLAVAALAHPAILLRDRRRRAHLSVALSVGFITLAAAIGVGLYPSYSAGLKPQIFVQDPRIGLLFERKEHLAFGAVVLTWTGAIAYIAALRVQRQQASATLHAELRRLAFRAYIGAVALAAIVAALGTWVATYKSF